MRHARLVIAALLVSTPLLGCSKMKERLSGAPPAASDEPAAPATKGGSKGSGGPCPSKPTVIGDAAGETSDIAIAGTEIFLSYPMNESIGRITPATRAKKDAIAMRLPQGLASANGQLFFTGHPRSGKEKDEAMEDGVFRVALAGGVPQRIASGAQAEGLALDDGWVYWTENAARTGRVGRVRADGTGAETFAAGEEGRGIAIGQGTVYWVRSVDAVMSMPTTKVGPAKQVFKAQFVERIALTPKYLFVATVSGIGAGDTSTVVRIARATNEATVLVRDEPLIKGLAADATHVYWTGHAKSEPGALKRVPVEGTGKPEVLSKDHRYVGAVAVDDACVYWADSTHAYWRAK